MLLLAGLGNPGATHAGNRHNIGFMAADAIHRRHGFGPWRTRFRSRVAEGLLAGRKVLLIEPQTYMNRSGEAIGEAMRFYKLGIEDLAVMYDELDLQPGKVRIKTGGGTGGHNGIRSIDSHCGNAFRRIRLGIGHPGDKTLVHRHVLGDFARADAEWLDPLLEAVAEYAPLLARGDDSTFMNRIALAMGEKAEPAPKKAQSHVRQARREPARSPSGKMAELLRKMLGSGDRGQGES